jgi:hypothetical protein
LKKWLIIGGVVFAILIIGLIVLISVADAWGTARDVSVVILAIFQMISTLLMIALLAVLIYAVMALRTIASETVLPKVSQTLDQVKDTAATAKNTSTYVAQGVATPLIKISSVAAGVKAAAVALAKRNPPDRFKP